MDPLAARDILSATGGSLAQGASDAMFVSLTTDTRSLERGSVFLALQGDRYDGHDFVGSAVQRGSKGLIVAHDHLGSVPSFDDDITIIAVDDTLVALGEIANHRRQAHPIPLIAVTGSNGKTSTKEFIAALLESRGEVLKTPGNHNNLIGVPLTLLELTDKHEFAVIEMGTNAPGEIKRLAAIAQPDVGVITNVSVAHTQGLADLRGVAREKGALFEALPDTGTAIVNLDDSRVTEESQRTSARRVFFGEAEPADFRIQEYRFGARKPRVSGTLLLEDGELEIDTDVLGFHQIRNAAAALAAVSAVGLSPRTHHPSLLSVAAAPHRMQFLEASGIWIIDDSYNANPASMRVALETLERCKNLAQSKARAIAVLGDMNELGAESAEAHRQVGELVVELKIDFLITVGEAAEQTTEAARDAGLRAVTHVKGPSEASEWVRRVGKPGDWLLVKGSRSMRLENIVDNLKQTEDL